VSEVATPWWSDDDQLLAALENATRAARDVPAGLVDAAKSVFAWRDIDAELAVLTYDSAVEDGRVPMVRDDQAQLRALIFVAPELTIELQVGPEALLGQVVPPGPGTAQAHLLTGDVVTTAIDGTGCFVFRPAPSGSFRLKCHSEGAHAATGWISL
jgi:hypothetical protein